MFVGKRDGRRDPTILHLFFFLFFFSLLFIFLRKRGREMMEKGSFQRIEK